MVLLHNLRICGAVRIEADRAFADAAAELGRGRGVQFLDDNSGRYEEFPACTATAAGFEFALLGIRPIDEQLSPEPIGDYTLQMQMSRELTRCEASQVCDASEFLAQLIKATTSLNVVER